MKITGTRVSMTAPSMVSDAHDLVRGLGRIRKLYVKEEGRCIGAMSWGDGAGRWAQWQDRTLSYNIRGCHDVMYWTFYILCWYFNLKNTPAALFNTHARVHARTHTLSLFSVFEWGCLD